MTWIAGTRKCSHCRRRPVQSLRGHFCDVCLALRADERIMQPRYNPAYEAAVLRKAWAAHEIVLD